MPMKQDSKVVPTTVGVPVGESARREEMGHRERDTISIHRHCITKSRFDLDNNFSHPKKKFKEKVGGIACSAFPRDCKTWQRRILSLFPFIGIMRGYGKSDLVNDLIAGLTVGVMHIPQGMAYGFLANIDPVYGLYTSFFAVLVYFFFGTSRHISIGVFAVVSLMIGNAVDKADCSSYLQQATNSTNQPFNLSTNQPINSTTIQAINLTTNSPISEYFSPTFHPSNATTTPPPQPTPSSGDPIEECKLQHALVATFLVGLIQLLMGIFRVGMVTTYLSEPLTRAFTTAAAVHVITSQLKHVFGISPQKFNGPFKIIYIYWSLATKMAQVNVATLITCVVCIAIIYSVQRWAAPALKKFTNVPIPAELIVMVIGTLISHHFHLSSPSVFGIKVLGNIPQGIPPPKVPDFHLAPNVILDAFAMSIVVFTINISMASIFSSKHSYKLESNQELIAYGMTNLVSSFFNCYISAASLSRSLVQESTGGKTQIAGIVASLMLLVVLLFVGPLFHDLPNCILAAVIIVNFKGIFRQILDITYLSKISTSDALIWIVTFISVILLDVDLGLLVGLAFSFLTIVIRNQVPKLQVLGHVEGTELYVNTNDYKDCTELSGVKIFSLSAPLFFANAETFIDNIKKVIQAYDAIDADKKIAAKRIITKSIDDELEGKALVVHNNNNNTTNNNHDLISVVEVTDRTNVLSTTLENKIDNTNSSSRPLTADRPLVEATTNHTAPFSDQSESELELAAVRKEVKMASSIHHVIIDFSQTCFIDVVGIGAVDAVSKLLSKRGIALSFASCNREVYKMLKKAMQMSKLAKCQMFVTLHDAVICAIA